MTKVVSTLVLILLFSSCDETYTPRPRGYFRIALPDRQYQLYDSICPYIFEYPVYGTIEPAGDGGEQTCWNNLQFRSFNATLHLSYKPVEDNLAQYLEDSRSLAMKHTQRASDIREVPIRRDSARVFGLLYDIRGNAASSLQFYLTDSTSHFLRASLYFNNVPNADSVAPVLDFLREDVEHLINTINWK